MNKVFLITKYFYPVTTGAGNRYRNIAPYLRKNELALSVLTLKYFGTKDYEKIDGIPIYRFGINYKLKDRSYFLEKKIFGIALRQKPKAVIFLHHSYRAFYLILILRLFGIHCIKNITMMPTKKKKSLKNYFINLLSYSVFSKIYCLNQSMKDRLIENKVRSSNIVVFPNGVDNKKFCPVTINSEKTNLRRKLDLPLNTKIILYVGFFIERKGVDLLLDAWNNISQSIDASLVLVGSMNLEGQDLDSLFKIKLKKKIKENESKKLIIRDYSDGIEEYYQASDMFIFLSRNEGMPNVLLEAMSCGLPTLITPFEGLSKEFGIKDKHYFLTEYSVEKISKSIKSILKNDQSQLIGSYAHNLIQKKLNNDVCIKKLSKFLNNL